MILRGIIVRLILEAKYGDDPLNSTCLLLTRFVIEQSL